MPNANLLATDLRCIRGDRVLFDKLSFSVQAGQCLHVVGANGSGKSSLLKILCGLNAADRGTVSWNTRDIRGNNDYGRVRAYVGHKDGLKNELTAVENLRHYQHLERVRDEAALDDCLHSMGVLNCADLPVQQLSFGQRRRLAFARLLLGPFQLWVMDEPFTGIDNDGRTQIEQHCIKHLEAGGAIIMTHHQSLTASPLAAFRAELRLD